MEASDGKKRSQVGVLALVAVLVGLATWYGFAVVLPRGYRAEVNDKLERAITLDASADGAIPRKLEELAAVFLSRAENAGIVIGVTVGGRRSILARGVVSKSRDAGPVSEETLFEIGSITKPFTGIALAQAALNGEVVLDQSIHSILGGTVSIPGLREHAITLADLATHRSGLPRLPPTIGWGRLLFQDNPYRGYTGDDLFEDLAASVETLPDDRDYLYSNYGFTLLARLLELATGTSYAELIESRICTPLGMDSTRVVLTDSTRPRLADGHSRGKRMDHWLEDRLPGSGGIASTANDMLTLIEAYLDPDANPLREAFELAATDRGSRGSDRKFIGLGWGISVGEDGLRRISHSGGSAGFRAYVGFIPETGVGVVVLANSNDRTARALGQRLLIGLGPQGPKGRHSALPDKP